MFGTHLPQERKSVGTKCSFIFPFVPPLIQLFFPIVILAKCCRLRESNEVGNVNRFLFASIRVKLSEITWLCLVLSFFPYCIWHSLCNRIHQQKLSFEKKKWKLKNKTANKFSRDESFFIYFPFRK